MTLKTNNFLPISLILLYLTFSFKFFYLTPLSFYSETILLILSILGLRIYFLSKEKTKFVKSFFYIILFLFLFSVLSGTLVLKQGLFSSISASKSFFNCFSIFTIFKIINDNKLNVEYILKSFFKICWLFWIYFCIFSFSGMEIHFENFIKPYVASKISTDFIYIMIFYYLSKWMINLNFIYLFLFIILYLSIHIADIQRADILFFLFVLFVVYFKQRKLYNYKKIIYISILFFVIISPTFVFLDFTALSEKFQGVFDLFNNPSNIKDASIFVRIHEMAIAILYFMQNPFLGVGMIHASSITGTFIGDNYFYPSDIGIIGVLFCFGLYGLFVYISQIIQFVRLKFETINQNSLIFAIYCLLMLKLIFSLLNGETMFSPLSFYLLMFFIVHLTKNQYQEFSNLK